MTMTDGAATNMYFGPGSNDPGGSAPPAWATGGAPATSTAPATTSTPISAPSDTQQSAKAQITAFLGKNGLAALGDWAWNRVLQLGGGQGAVDQMLLELNDQQAYKDRYPYMADLAAKGRAITEQQAQDLERTFVQIAKAANLPDNFMTKTYIDNLIAGETSPVEFQKRVDLGVQATYNAVPEQAAELNRLYGIGRGDITALVLDPKTALPILQQQMAAAQNAAAAKLGGFGELTQDEAERLAQLGITFGQAQQGFGHLFHERQIFTPLPGEQGAQTITPDQQLGAEFGGDAQSLEAIQRQSGARLAPFQGGGSFQESSKGVVGLGSANTP